MLRVSSCPFFFFFNDTATTEIYTLSLHDALPISPVVSPPCVIKRGIRELLKYMQDFLPPETNIQDPDRKSTRLNSSHQIISYAVFCLKKKKKIQSQP